MPAPHPISVIAHQLLEGHPPPPPWRERRPSAHRVRRAAHLPAAGLRLAGRTARRGAGVVVHAWRVPSGTDGRARMP